jgi:hypothetical protein
MGSKGTGSPIARTDPRVDAEFAAAGRIRHEWTNHRVLPYWGTLFLHDSALEPGDQHGEQPPSAGLMDTRYCMGCG